MELHESNSLVLTKHKKTHKQLGSKYLMLGVRKGLENFSYNPNFVTFIIVTMGRSVFS